VVFALIAGFARLTSDGRCRLRLRVSPLRLPRSQSVTEGQDPFSFANVSEPPKAAMNGKQYFPLSRCPSRWVGRARGRERSCICMRFCS
jgi:hypothetical protein